MDESLEVLAFGWIEILDSKPKLAVGTDYIIIGWVFGLFLFISLNLLLGVKNFYEALLLDLALLLLLSFLLIDELFSYST